MNNLGTKTLETERLILRKYNQDDFEMLYKNYVSDENVPKFCTWKPCKTKEEALNKITKKSANRQTFLLFSRAELVLAYTAQGTYPIFG